MASGYFVANVVAESETMATFAAMPAAQSHRLLFSISDPSSRSCLLLCLGIGLCLSVILVLRRKLLLAQTRLQRIPSANATEIASNDYQLLGDFAMMQKKEQLARRCYTRAAALDPGNTSVHCELGKSLFQEKRYADAIKEFRVVLTGEPIPPEMYHYLAFSYLALNQIKQAEYYYEQSQKHQDDERKTRLSLPSLQGFPERIRKKGVAA